MRKTNDLYSLIVILSLFFISDITAQIQDSVYFTTGFKIGEVTDSSAIFWVRLCKDNQPVATYHKRKKTTFRHPINFDDYMSIQKMDGAVEGIFGQVKIELISKDTVIRSDWSYVSTYKDFTLKKKFEQLAANTEYDVRIQGRSNENAPITEVRGKFTTAPTANEPVSVLFTSSTCQYYWSFDDDKRGFKIYDEMAMLNPLFHCQTGDYVYYDKPGPMARNLELARHKWHAMNSWPALSEFYMHTPLYQQKDDHDLLKDDADPQSTPFGTLTYEDGLLLWREQVPIIGTPYRTFRWGKDLQLWIVEGREYRSRNDMSDSADKTIWGKEQINWFKATVEASDASFKILVSPTPIVGPDRSKGKYDNHSNLSFETEGKWLREYLARHNMLVINGDRHWQYVSIDPKSGLWEFSQGPVSDFHAQGWSEEDIRPEHRFLRVKGGFLATRVYRDDDLPMIEFTHYDSDGNKVHQEIISAKETNRK